MTRLGMVARADLGGLAAQTSEARRHLHPVATWVVDLGPGGRGPNLPELLGPQHPGEAVRVAPVDDHAAQDWLLERCDVVFACETVYGARLTQRAAQLGKDVVVQVNPELFTPLDYPGARFVVPTRWEQHRVEGAPVLPVPVARDRLPYRRRTQARVFYHPAAPAMLDRNGTMMLVAALSHLHAPVKVYLRAAKRSPRHPRVLVELLEPHVGPYYEAYPEDVDVVVLPRRYGGLSLPMQEAASLGCPVVSLDLEPQASWPHVHGVPTTRAQPAPMRGGHFDVHEASSQAVADAMAALVEAPARVDALSAAADEWAEALAWPAQLDAYRRVLGL